MDIAELLVDAFDRVRSTVERVVEGRTVDQLAFRPGDTGNSAAWLVWHLSRVQDDHVAGVAGAEQVWTSAGWVERFGLPFAPTATGYGQDAAEVAAVRASAADLLGYHRAVHEASVAYLARLGPVDLDRVVDEHWDPPVTLGVRLVSVIGDDLQHAGQAAYVLGLQ